MARSLPEGDRMSQDTLLPEADKGAFDRICSYLNPEWVEQALQATGTATVRRRRLPVGAGHLARARNGFVQAPSDSRTRGTARVGFCRGSALLRRAASLRRALAS